MNNILLIFYIRKARLKARSVAIMEAFCLLVGLEPKVLNGGPLSEISGTFWLEISKRNLEDAMGRFNRLGYSYKVDYIVPTDKKEDSIVFHKSLYKVLNLYTEDPEVILSTSPDKRTFIYEDKSGNIRSVKGYRGDSSETGRRGLPVYDARLLVNLVKQTEGNIFLDPFAGAGGVVFEAINSGYNTSSTDIDSSLKYGLKEFGSKHFVADAIKLPFKEKSFNSIATEPPYSPNSTNTLDLALGEMNRVLKSKGKVSILCADHQADLLREKSKQLKLKIFLDSPINRKGTEVHVLAFEKL